MLHNKRFNLGSHETTSLRNASGLKRERNFVNSKKSLIFQESLGKNEVFLFYINCVRRSIGHSRASQYTTSFVRQSYLVSWNRSALYIKYKLRLCAYCSRVNIETT